MKESSLRIIADIGLFSMASKPEWDKLALQLLITKGLIRSSYNPTTLYCLTRRGVQLYNILGSIVYFELN